MVPEGCHSYNHWVGKLAVICLQSLVHFEHLLHSLHAIHDGHLQVHENEVDVVSAARLLQIGLVLLQSLFPICARFNFDFEQLINQKLERYGVEANVVDNQASVLAAAPRIV